MTNGVDQQMQKVQLLPTLPFWSALGLAWLLLHVRIVGWAGAYACAFGLYLLLDRLWKLRWPAAGLAVPAYAAATGIILFEATWLSVGGPLAGVLAAAAGDAAARLVGVCTMRGVPARVAVGGVLLCLSTALFVADVPVMAALAGFVGALVYVGPAHLSAGGVSPGETEMGLACLVALAAAFLANLLDIPSWAVFWVSAGSGVCVLAGATGQLDTESQEEQHEHSEADDKPIR